MNNWVAEGHEFFNMTVAYFMVNLIVQRYDVKFSQDHSVNADMGKLHKALYTYKLYNRPSEFKIDVPSLELDA